MYLLIIFYNAIIFLRERCVNNIFRKLYIKDEDAEKVIKQEDKQRAEYYKHFTSQTWGDKNNFDITIDTSVLGVEETINVLESYIRKRIG